MVGYPGDGLVGHSSDGAVGHSSDGAVGHSSDGAVGHSSDGAVGHSSDGAVGHSSDGAVGHSSDGAVGHSRESAEFEAAALEFAFGASRRRALVVVNPHATTVSPRLRSLVVNALSSRYDVDAIDTQAPGHATEICREGAFDGYDVAVAFGGEGPSTR